MRTCREEPLEGNYRISADLARGTLTFLDGKARIGAWHGIELGLVRDISC